MTLIPHHHRCSADAEEKTVMSGKLKQVAEAGQDGQLAAQIRNSANQIWLAGLGAFVRAQGEGTKMFESLVKEGEIAQNRAKKLADDRISEARAKATDTWEKLEQVFENRVERALHSLNVPTRSDIDTLSKRVAELTAVTKKLTSGTSTPKAHVVRARSSKSASSRSSRAV
jgi:poly(hydroxyalkanoate) granule-associated protein